MELKGILKICSPEASSMEPRCFIMTQLKDNFFSFELNYAPNFSVKKLLQYDDDLINGLKYDIEFYKNSEIFEDETMEKNDSKLKYILANKPDLLEMMEYVDFTSFSNDYDIVLKILNDNPELKTKKIIVGENLKVEQKFVEEIKKYFGQAENIYVSLEDNVDYICLKQYEETVKQVDTRVEMIKKYNLSPLEQLMFAYDIVRNREYKKEDENEFFTKSRDLTNVLLGDKIVCSGYVVVLKNILDKLGIKNQKYHLTDNKNGGHAIIMVYVNDSKYGTEGIFYFDPTFDNRKSIDDKYFKYSYRYFGLNYGQMKKIYEFYNLYDQTLPEFSNSLDFIYEGIIRGKGYEAISDEMIKTINKISSLVDDREVSLPLYSTYHFDKSRKNIDHADVIKHIKKYIKLMNQQIDADILVEVLYNVKKCEYYDNLLDYPLNYGYFFNTVLYSNWQYITLEDIDHDAPDYEMNMFAKFYLFQSDFELEKKIERLKLTKVLKDVSNKKRNF